LQAIILAVAESLKAACERAIELFNYEFAAGRTGISDETRALYAPEPVIVPFRAALEGNEYAGPSALEDFGADTRESWTWVQIEPERIRKLDAQRALIVGELRGRGRQTGAETSAPVAFLLVLREGRIAEIRTYLSEDAALSEVEG
jgi:ketosteroid isomerase-like protein